MRLRGNSDGIDDDELVILHKSHRPACGAEYTRRPRDQGMHYFRGSDRRGHSGCKLAESFQAADGLFRNPDLPRRTVVRMTEDGVHPDDAEGDHQRDAPAKVLEIAAAIERARLSDEEHKAQTPPHDEGNHAGPDAAVPEAEHHGGDEQGVERGIVVLLQQELSRDRRERQGDGEAVSREARRPRRRVVRTRSRAMRGLVPEDHRPT